MPHLFTIPKIMKRDIFILNRISVILLHFLILRKLSILYYVRTLYRYCFDLGILTAEIDVFLALNEW